MTHEADFSWDGLNEYTRPLAGSADFDFTPIYGFRYFRVTFTEKRSLNWLVLAELKFDDDIDLTDAVYSASDIGSFWVVGHLKDGNPNTLWSPGSELPQSVDITFPEKVLPSVLRLRSDFGYLSGDPTDPKSFTVSASENGSDYFTILTIVDDPAFSTGELRSYDLGAVANVQIPGPEGTLTARAFLLPKAIVTLPGLEGSITVLADFLRDVRVILPGPEGVLRGSLFNDFSGIIPVEARIYYACELVAEGLPPLRVAISSWQATSQIEQASFAQIVIPGVLDLLSDIQAYADSDGEFIVYRGAQLPGSDAKAESPLIRSPMQTLRFQRGPANATLTISGYTVLPTPDVVTTRILQNIRSQTLEPRQRIRCDIDWFLAPGFTASALGDSFVVGWINYYANAQDSYMDVGETGTIV